MCRWAKCICEAPLHEVKRARISVEPSSPALTSSPPHHLVEKEQPHCHIKKEQSVVPACEMPLADQQEEEEDDLLVAWLKEMVRLPSSLHFVFFYC